MNAEHRRLPSPRFRPNALLTALAVVLFTLALPLIVVAEPVIAIVNGDSLTTADLDAALMEMHRTSAMADREDVDFTRIVDKVINDRLILQEARAMGLDEEPDVLSAAERRRREEAIKRYIRARFTFSDSIPDDTVRAHFETYYPTLELHQITLETEAKAHEIRARLLEGAPWDSLATALSVDAHRYRGGKHNTKPLADVEFAIRDAIADLDDGEISDVFPYADHYAIVRLDMRRPADLEDLPRYESGIRRYLLDKERQRAWDAFVAEHLARTPVARNEEVIESIRTDSTLVLRGEFRIGTDALALRLDDRFVVDERELRLAVSRAAMENADRPFDTHVESAIARKSHELVLSAAAEAGGYFSEPDVLRMYERDLRTSLIEAYLQETVVPQISFNRDEFEAYYREHERDFTEPEQVQIATLLVEDEATAREMAGRLREGADFGYIKRQYIGPDNEATQSEPSWSAVTLFSDDIRAQLDQMEIGAASEAIDIGHNWLVFKLVDRRPGPVKELSVVEHEIRQVMFNRKFKDLLDEHLALLKERSQIERFPEEIATYLDGDS